MSDNNYHSISESDIVLEPTPVLATANVVSEHTDLESGHEKQANQSEALVSADLISTPQDVVANAILAEDIELQTESIPAATDNIAHQIFHCLQTKVGWTIFIVLIFCIVGLSIAFLVFTIMSLVRTSNNEQKHICHQSSAWIYVLIHLLLNGFLYNNNDNNNNDDDNKSVCTICSNLTKLAGIAAMTAWGIFELFGVHCVKELKGKLLYVILQIFVIVDIITMGFLVLVIIGTCGLVCFATNRRQTDA